MMTSTHYKLRAATILLGSSLSFSLQAAAPKKEEVVDPNAPVSFYKQIRPIFQGQCYGCHQPSKSKGDYVMTDFARMLKGGEEGNAIVASKPDASYLLKEIVPNEKGKVEMPQKADPLHETQVALIKRWITEGAKDDTPASARQQYDMEHPPIYRTAPLVTSLDYSPDGKIIAVAGYHEVLLHKADGSGIEARFVGLSERIQSVRFSPDGTKLAVAGGSPGRMGEIQVWDVAKKKLDVSASVTFDTLYGASWSPDNKLIAFGGSDNSMRAIDAATGKEVLFTASSNDWVLDTVWSKDGSHIMAASRDMSVKLTEVANKRFIDNMTSITPGALRGGIHALVRHPQRDEILIGGADGIPQIYRMERLTKRVIGDNANLIRKFPAMEGRIFSVDYSSDGKTIVCASTFENKGTVNIYSADFDSNPPKEVLDVLMKPTDPKLLAWVTSDVKLLKSISFPQGGMFAVNFSPDGKTIAVAGGDGVVRLIDVAAGTFSKEFLSVPIADETTLAKQESDHHDQIERSDVKKALTPESLSKGVQVSSLEVFPKTIKISQPTEYAQLLVTARMKDGTSADVTRMVKMEAKNITANISPRGMVRPKDDGKGTVTISLASQKVEVPLEVSGMTVAFKPDYVHDVMPVLSKAGCNAGTCHGSKEGKSGFKLSLRGYDPDYDVKAFAEELWSRRANVAAPSHSLMLLKASGAVPHEGGQVTVPGELYYETIKSWIASGARLKQDSPRVTRIEIFPMNPVVETIGARQQMRVLATYANGEVKDVTAESFIDSGNTEVAETDKQGLVTTIRRGEAPVLARFEGAYAATTVTVMGDRSAFVWAEPAKSNKIDEFVAKKWQRMKIQPSDLCTDNEFLRRIYLDLTGLPPSADEVRAFMADQTEQKAKREQLVDKLIGSDAYVEQWSNKWADMLQVNSKFLGDEGATAFRAWIRDQVAKNTPYDKFAYSILTASGSNKENPAASYFKILRTPEETMENTTHLFLATRFNCNKCHDHPFERWNQNQYYETSAFFAQVGFQNDPASNGKTIGGTAVEGAKPLYEIVKDTGSGEVKHLRTGKDSPPTFPFPAKFVEKKDAPRREKLAAWMTSADNQYFAMSYANRIWGYLTGTGVIEPLDDIRAGNPPSNPELLNYLTQEFVNSGFNVRHLMQLVCKSRAYQLSLATNQWNADDKINYSHAKPRRLSAEALFDAIYKVTGTTSKIPGVKPGTRAAQLADSQTRLADGFLGNFGRPVRESVCECERSSGMQLGPVMALVSGPTVGDAISDPNNEIAKLVKSIPEDHKLVEELFMRILNRMPTPNEINAVLASTAGMDVEHKTLSTEWSAYEVKLAPEIARMEQDRHAKIVTAEKQLDDYKKQQAPIIAKAEADRSLRIKKEEAVVKVFADASVAKQSEWEPYMDLSTEWQPLDLQVGEIKGVQKIEKQADGSLFVTAMAGEAAVDAIYNLKGKTHLKGITGIKIEALPDERLPNNGPGLSPDGNFVLTEFTVSQVPLKEKRGGPGKAARDNIKLLNPRADFEQKDFALAKSINGIKDVSDAGWAVSPNTGRRHEAIFECEAETTGFDEGTALTITLQQGFQRQRFQLGRFKIYVTTSPRPLRFGASQSLAQVLRIAPEKRTKEQQASLREGFLFGYSDYQKAKQGLVAARKPLPVDPKLGEFETNLADAQKAIALDPKLVQLRRDSDLSKQQLINKRLTAAQDLAWALINSPAFLFNH